MRNIQRIKNLFQKILKSAIYIFRICFNALPEVQPRPFICYESDYEQKVKKLTESVRAFNLKKRGDAK